MAYYERLSALDASFIGLEDSRCHMHVGGVFIFDDLAPGRYVFGVNITKPLRGTPQGASVFLPGVPNASDAKVIELTAGDEVNVGVLRLPPR